MAASIPHPYYYLDYSSLPTDFCSFPASEEEASSSDIIICPINNNSNNYGEMNYMLPPLMSHDVSSPVSVTSSFPDHHLLLHSDSILESETQVFKSAEDNRIHAQNWAIEGNSVIRKVEESEVKVGKYSVEEKKSRILRYLNKKNKRNFNKTIKYVCRKTLADKRIRIRGRFAKNIGQQPPSEDDEHMS